ncbi:hypothetical protein JCM4814A_49380 [Streptomyces phaeofaciens JCM 4814]|uniref:Regulatory protein n=1 Tax=Streptomyces phaeofaciens TaxID=68254 RepID=A0A918LPR0_9ACTN|nr:hypothetical protein [Streptomyces phaeofaciens]GGT32603.1 hypothetical protein GCM10010226_06040 [Streptomyces phaeofaciens]
MSETTVKTSELTSQYSSQVANDLERNLKEQQRLTDEIEALQEQLTALGNDHAVLVNIRQALGVTAADAVEPAAEPVAEPVAAPAAEPVAAVPAPRKKAATTAKSAKQTKARKTTATPAKRTAGKSAAKASAAPAAQRTLVELVREHLVGQSEPRSAAEITATLEQQHPERAVKTTVVRTTLEGLVAKNQAQRTKQGTSVFYTTTDATGPAADGEQAPQPSA